jgi:hypothetical protein
LVAGGAISRAPSRALGLRPAELAADIWALLRAAKVA